MMLMRKVTAELHVARVAAVSVALVEDVLQREVVAHQIEAAVLLSVAMEMMLVAEDLSAAVEAVVAKLAARSLATMMIMAIGVTSSRASHSS